MSTTTLTSQEIVRRKRNHNKHQAKLKALLAAGKLQCACTKRAVVIKNSFPVCARCAEIEKNMYKRKSYATHK